MRSQVSPFSLVRCAAGTQHARTQPKGGFTRLRCESRLHTAQHAAAQARCEGDREAGGASGARRKIGGSKTIVGSRWNECEGQHPNPALRAWRVLRLSICLPACVSTPLPVCLISQAAVALAALHLAADARARMVHSQLRALRPGRRQVARAPCAPPSGRRAAGRRQHGEGLSCKILGAERACGGGWRG